MAISSVNITPANLPQVSPPSGGKQGAAGITEQARQGKAEAQADILLASRSATLGSVGALPQDGPALSPPQTPAPAVEDLKNGLQGALDAQLTDDLKASGAKDDAAAAGAAPDAPVKRGKGDNRALPQGPASLAPSGSFDFEKNFQILAKVMSILLAYAGTERANDATMIRLAQDRVKLAGERQVSAAQDRLGSSIGAAAVSIGVGVGSMYTATKAAHQEMTSAGVNGRLAAEGRAQAAAAQRAGGQAADSVPSRPERFIEATDGTRTRVGPDSEGDTPAVRRQVEHQVRETEADHHQTGDRVVQANSQKLFARAQLLNLIANSTGGAVNATGEIVAAGDDAERMVSQQAADAASQTAQHHAESVTQAVQLVNSLFSVLQNWQRQNLDTATAITGNLRA